VTGPVRIRCDTLVIDGAVQHDVTILVDAAGRVADVRAGDVHEPGDIHLGTVLPGFGNAHSHAFHRALRGRTHADGGDFWQWRQRMYEVAGSLTPDSYYTLATAVFAEMLVSGYTAVGEFHYVHHRPDGEPYDVRHAMELALAAAARDVGIRLVLLDTVYLEGGIGRPLAAEQLRFGDRTAAGWLTRWHSLREQLAGAAAADDLVSLGAAMHSVRAVTPSTMREVLAGLPADAPLHIHLSEQVQENADCIAEYGLTPTALLDSVGALGPRLSVVHATHLSEADIAGLGAARVTVVMCPTTEADLGDGIGPALNLAGAGSPVALGSDQNAVIDPFLEMRGLEMGERLVAERRGRFTPAALLTAASAAGYNSLGLGRHRLQPGDLCDLVEVDPASLRTAGSLPDQLPLTATAGDVLRVIVGGRLVADGGRLVARSPQDSPRRPAALLADALAHLEDHR
jgi:formiminoglutamate deiminase